MPGSATINKPGKSRYATNLRFIIKTFNDYKPLVGELDLHCSSLRPRASNSAPCWGQYNWFSQTFQLERLRGGAGPWVHQAQQAQLKLHAAVLNLAG